MNRSEACGVLGVAIDAPWAEVRSAYRTQIGTHHPDRAGDADMAARINQAYRTLEHHRRTARGRSDRPDADRTPPTSPPPPPPPPDPSHPRSWPDAPPPPGDHIPAVERMGSDTLAFWAPPDETFRWLLDSVHDVGEITYLDRSMPIVEVLCRFVGEPATSLLISLQGRAHHTEVICSTESIEARPGPPTAMVVDLVEDALRRRAPAPPM